MTALGRSAQADHRYRQQGQCGQHQARRRGPFARSIMKAQVASLPFTPVFAALVSILDIKLPTMGELLLHRLIS